MHFKYNSYLKYLCGVLWCFVFLPTPFICAQESISLEYATININNELQLKSVETYHINRDSKGFLWICTDLGVYRYDGFNSQHFTINDGLLSNVVFETYEDDLGRIWFLGKSTELNYYLNGEIHPYEFNNKIREYCPYSQTDRKEIHVINKDVYYATNSCGFIKVNSKGELTKYKDTPGFSTLNVLPNKKLIFSYTYTNRNTKNVYENGSFSNLMHLNYKNKTIEIDSMNTERTEKFDLKYLQFNGKELEGLGIIGSNLVKFPEKKNLIESISCFVKDSGKEDSYWLGTSQGCYLVELIDDTVVKFENIKSLEGNYISSIYSDSSGNTFFTSLENGVFFLSNQRVSKLKIEKRIIGEQDLIDMASFKDELLLSTKKKVLNLSKGLDYPGKFSLLHNYKDSLLFISDMVNQVKKHPLLTEREDFIAYNFTRDFEEFNNSLFSVSNYLMKYEIKTEKYSFPYQSLKSEIKDQDIRHLEKSENGVFFGTSSRIYKFVQDSVNLVKYFPQMELTDFLILDTSKILISTKSKGIKLLHNDSIHKVEALGKLPQLNYSTRLFKYKNYILIGTYQGLVKYDLVKDKGMSVGPNHGFKNKKVKFIKSIKNQLYIAVSNEIYTLNEIQIERMFNNSKDTNKLKAELVELNLDGEKIDLKTVEISYFSDFIHLIASVKDFTIWRNRKYQYRLNENQQWNTVLSPEVTFSNPKSSFNLEMRYQQNDGSWSQPIINRHFKITPPFYKNNWFLILVVSVFGLIIYLIVKGRLNRRIRELVAERNLTSYQQRLQNARIRPHFIFNVLNSINSHIIFEENTKASNYLIKFSKMLRKVLDYSGQEYTLLQDELSLIKSYLELEQLRNDKLNFSIVSNEENMKVNIPSLLIQPFVENAVLHGKENDSKQQIITVEISKEDHECLKICVINTVDKEDIVASNWEVKNDKNAIGISSKRLSQFNTLKKTNKYKLHFRVKDGELTACIYLPIIDDNPKNN